MLINKKFNVNVNVKDKINVNVNVRAQRQTQPHKVYHNFGLYTTLSYIMIYYKAADNKSVDAIHERSAPSWRHLSKAANNKSVDARLVLSTEHCSGLIDRLFVVLSTDSLTDPNTASPFQVVLSTDFSISATVTQKSSTCNFCTIACCRQQICGCHS